MNLGFLSLFIFIFGLAVGSFLNCLIYRLKTGEGFLGGRSYCPYCKHKLSFKDLIPIFSFLILRGRCRYCQQKISLQYPLVELSTAILFLLPITIGVTISDNWLNLFFYWLFSSFLIIIFAYDLKYYIIPDKIIYPAIATAFIYNIILREQFSLMRTGLVAILASAFFLSIVLVSHGKWMGLGDVKLAFFMGLFLGWPNILVALFLAFFIGAIIGIGLVILGKKTLKSEVPFGPFLVTGTFLALFFSQNLIDWYLGLFLI